MNVKILIYSIVRQTTVLIAQLATAGGRERHSHMSRIKSFSTSCETSASTGGSGAGGANADGGSQGHLFLIGSSYMSHGRDDELLLENAVFLNPKSGTVRVLDFLQFVRDGYGSSWDQRRVFMHS